ncbi:MAG: tetratricopeptide repeat protein [Tannerella sp.]|jgi:TolA-binding protein|nr:tetratricopeptide repeat protein [Tannerella sp.]
MKTKKIILITLCLTVTLFASNGQRSYRFDAPDRLFAEGKAFFDLKNYAGCIDKLEEYKRVAKNKDLVQEADFMIAYIAYEQGKHLMSNMLVSYLDKYPDTRHADIVRFLIGNCSFENDDYEAAERNFSQTNIEVLDADQQEELLYRLAFSQLQNQQLNEARQNFAIAREYNSKYAKASTFYIAYIDYSDGKYAEALKHFNTLRKDNEFGTQSTYYIAQIDFLNENYDEVVRLAERLLKNNPEDAIKTELYRISGISYYQLNNQDKAISVLRKYVASTDKPSRKELYMLGVCEFNAGAYAKSIATLSQTTLETDELTQNASLYLGYDYLKTNDKNNARMSFEQAASMSYDKKVQEAALYNYALLIHETSFTGFGESVKVFERFLNDFPNSLYADKVYDYLVEEYLTSKNYQAALESIDKIKKPTNKILEAKQNVLFQLGNQEFMNQDAEAAIDYFTQSIELGNYDSEARSNAYFWRGESYYRTERYTKAITDFNTYQGASKQRSSDLYSLVYYNTGYCYFHLKEYNQALIAFRRYTTLENQTSTNTLSDTYNRIGDCLFFQRQYAEAGTNYQRAAELMPEAADYSIYQKGFAQGLQKDYNGKIRTLDRLINEYPSSQYIDDALFERGRTYVLIEQYNDAALSFSRLIDNHPQSILAPKAGVQLGLLYYNMNRLEDAVTAYKRVVKNYSGSEEAKVALQDLKSVYIDLNDIASYAEYLNSQGGIMHLEVNEQDSLTYLAAEKVFTKGDKVEAQRSLENYVRSFPDGAFSSNANFYLAKINFDKKNYPEAKHLFDLVLKSGNTKFREESLARKSEIEYLAKDYEDAIITFRELAAVAESHENIEAAKLGIMRCAQYTGHDKEALEAATELLKETKLSPEIQAEARYLRAKANIKLGNPNKAIDDLKILSKDTRTEYGAESKFLLARLYFEKKDLTLAEKVLTEFIESGTPHQYWLARGFILMSDIYDEKGDKFQARQYLTSLQRNYKGNEEIDGMIENRLKKLK